MINFDDVSFDILKVFMATAQLETSNSPFLPGAKNDVPIQITAARNLHFTTENVSKYTDAKATKATMDATTVTTSEDTVTTPDVSNPVTISGVFQPPSADDITKPITTDDSNPIFTGDIPPPDSNNVLSVPGNISKVSIYFLNLINFLVVLLLMLLVSLTQPPGFIPFANWLPPSHRWWLFW